MKTLILAGAIFGIAAFPFSLRATTITIQDIAGEVQFPKADFRDSTMGEILTFLSIRSRELDRYGYGVNLVLKEKAGPFAKPYRLSAVFKDTSMTKVLESVAARSGFRLRWDVQAVILIDPKCPDGEPNAPRPEIRKLDGDISNELWESLSLVFLPKIDLRDKTAREALEFIKKRSKDLSPDGGGVRLVLKLTEEASLPKITLALQNVSTGEAIRYVAELADLEVSMDKTTIYVTGPKAK
jgi:hypothetical protein